LKNLRPVHSARHDAYEAAPGCLPGTRKALLRQVKDWIHAQDAAPIFWLVGLAGTGKTSIAHSVCQDVGNHVAASFFFSQDTAERRRLSAVLPTLAYQLAGHSTGLKNKICDILKGSPDIAMRSLQIQVATLFNPLKSLPKESSRFIIVLDALDECEDETGDLLPLLVTELQQHRLNIKLFVTSRPEVGIGSKFRKLRALGAPSLPLVLHDITQSVVQADIRLYLERELQKIAENDERLANALWPTAADVDALVMRAGSLFVVAATVVKYLSNTVHGPERQLRSFLNEEEAASISPYSAIDQLYQRIVLNSLGNDQTQYQTQVERFQNVVGFIIMLQDPLPEKILERLLGLEDGEVHFALYRLHAVLLVPPAGSNNPIRVFHPSFSDFVTNPSRCMDRRFLLVPRAIHNRLAQRCLVIMSTQLMQNICDLEDPSKPNSSIDIAMRVKNNISPELQYACAHWSTHITLGSAPATAVDLFPLVSNFVYERLLTWIEVLSLLNKLDLAIHALKLIETWCKVGFWCFKPSSKR
jgi:hypothetical protein